MDLQAIIKARESWLNWKNIQPLRSALAQLPDIPDAKLILGNVVTLRSEMADSKARTAVAEAARMMKPWRKGPFDLFGTYIDSEWRSDKKFNLLAPFMDLEGKTVADVGCNNGYYMFRMLEQNPKSVLGVDPSPLFKTQFDLINRYAQAPHLRYEMLGIEHMAGFEQTFDTLFCLGVLYHRSDPIAALKSLKSALKRGGELFLDTFYIEGDAPVCLVPESTYSKIPNIHFIPTVTALEHWCKRAGFERFEVLATVRTGLEEQRKTDWIEGQSLNDFLNPDNPDQTVEGYPAPRRIYIKTYRK